MKLALVAILLATLAGVLTHYYLVDKTVCDFKFTSRDFRMCIEE